MTQRVREVANRTGFSLDPFARVDSLSVGAQQRVEIAKALTRDASLLILDEPSAVLAPSEVDDLLRTLFRIPEIECNCPIWRKFFQHLASVGTHGDLDVEPPCGPEKIADPVRRGRDQQEQAWHHLTAAKTRPRPSSEGSIFGVGTAPRGPSRRRPA